MSARVLVTGVMGFVGTHLARRLAERGDAVFGVGVEELSERPGRSLEGYWSADIRDGVTVGKVVEEAQPTAVVHLAAQSSVSWSFRHPVETYAINALGTYTLLDSVRRSAPGARVLVVGTGDVYGALPEGTRAREDAPFQPMNPYALSKAASDTIAETCGRLWDMNIVRTRSFGHVGAGQMTPFMLPSWCRQIAEIEAGMREPVLRVGNLRVTRDLTDVRDVVDAYLKLLGQGRAGASYNVCRGEGVRLDVVADSLCGRARVPIRIEADPSLLRATDIPYLVGDPTRIAEDTGWRATIPLDRSLEETLEDWRRRIPADRAH